MGLPFACRPAYSLGKTVSPPCKFILAPSVPFEAVVAKSTNALEEGNPFPLSLYHPPKAFEDMLNPDWKANIGHFEGKTCPRSG